MSKAAVSITAVERKSVGGTAAAVRRQGYVPAILYGHGVAVLELAIERKAFQKLLPELSKSTLLALTIGGADARRVLISEVQRDPMTGDPIHLDFHQVKLTEKIRARVPLQARGVSAAVKDRGGVLVQSISEIEVEALPQDLPSEIPVDIAALATFEDRITVADLAVPAGVEVHAKPGEVVAVVSPPKSEEELKAELETPTAAPAAAEVKTEAETKKAADEAKHSEEGAAEGEKPSTPSSSAKAPGARPGPAGQGSREAKKEEKKPETKKG